MQNLRLEIFRLRCPVAYFRLDAQTARRESAEAGVVVRIVDGERENVERNNKPAFEVFTVTESTDSTQRSIWRKIGAAFPHKNDSGLTCS